jgi:hypothetical protein
MKRRIWLWLLRLSYTKIATASPELPDGVPGFRSKDAQCSGYSPRKLKPGDFTDCEGDGHYLCKECCHLINKDDE